MAARRACIRSLISEANQSTLFGAKTDLGGKLTQLHALIDRGARQAAHVAELLYAQETILRGRAGGCVMAGSGRRWVRN